MAINYVIRAHVTDIEMDQPISGEAFLVDSNVWFWMAYTNASHGVEPWRQRFVDTYPRYVHNAMDAGARLLRCGLSLAELAHRIEETERAIFNASVKPKEFRHNHSGERQKVVEEVDSAWAVVKQIAEPAELQIDEPTTESALTGYRNHPLDGYDLFLLELMVRHRVSQIITDDGDFATLPDIHVFTANQAVIRAAEEQSCLVVR